MKRCGSNRPNFEKTAEARFLDNGEPRILTCTIAFFEKKNKGKVPLNFQPCSGQVLITDISVYKHFLAS